jgi:gas vesicle protein
MKFWVGLVTGFAAGITVGLLFAPARGIVTRRRIAQTASDFADSSCEKAQNFTKTAKRNARNVSKAANEKVQWASDFARERADEIGEAVGAVRDKIHRATA